MSQSIFDSSNYYDNQPLVLTPQIHTRFRTSEAGIPNEGVYPPGLGIYKTTMGVVKDASSRLPDKLPTERDHAHTLLKSEHPGMLEAYPPMLFQNPEPVPVPTPYTLKSNTELLMEINTYQDGTRKQTVPDNTQQRRGELIATYRHMMSRAEFYRGTPGYEVKQGEARDYLLRHDPQLYAAISSPGAQPPAQPVQPVQPAAGGRHPRDVQPIGQPVILPGTQQPDVSGAVGLSRQEEVDDIVDFGADRDKVEFDDDAEKIANQFIDNVRDIEDVKELQLAVSESNMDEGDALYILEQLLKRHGAEDISLLAFVLYQFIYGDEVDVRDLWDFTHSANVPSTGRAQNRFGQFPISQADKISAIANPNQEEETEPPVYMPKKVEYKPTYPVVNTSGMPFFTTSDSSFMTPDSSFVTPEMGAAFPDRDPRAAQYQASLRIAENMAFQAEAEKKIAEIEREREREQIPPALSEEVKELFNQYSSARVGRDIPDEKEREVAVQFMEDLPEAKDMGVSNTEYRSALFAAWALGVNLSEVLRDLDDEAFAKSVKSLKDRMASTKKRDEDMKGAYIASLNERLDRIIAKLRVR